MLTKTEQLKKKRAIKDNPTLDALERMAEDIAELKKKEYELELYGNDFSHIKGEPGRAGKDGIRGEKGDSGNEGLRGEVGERGKEGNKGKAGKQGIKGQQGRLGENGRDGDNGNPPKHEVLHNRIRFENPDGTWGVWLDIESKDKGMGGKSLHRGGKVLENKTITSDYTASARDELILADTTNGALTVTLPLTSNAPKFEIHIKKIDSTENTVTIQGQNSETIDDETSIQILTSERSLRLYSNGTKWYII